MNCRKSFEFEFATEKTTINEKLIIKQSQSENAPAPVARTFVEKSFILFFFRSFVRAFPIFIQMERVHTSNIIIINECGGSERSTARLHYF